MKSKKKTAEATKKAANVAKDRREITRELIRREVFDSFCECGKCSQGDYKNLCMSNREIARTCNTLEVPTTTGKIGTWQPTTVKRLYKEFHTEPATLEDFLM